MIENKIEKIDRHQAKIDAERESKEADLKQHADKLVQGFGKIDAASAIRAIWELVQNACDLSPSCNVTIDYSKNGFSFSHNGKPFTTSTLLSLIKQVSNKGGGPEVGKFGTGFITTHAFGRKFILNSILDVNGQFIEIKDFVIDRSPKEWKSMVDNLIVQEEQVYNLLENGALIQEQECLTTFTYLPATEIEKGAIRDSLDNLDTYIPIVLTLNKRLSSVTVIDFLGKKTIYQKKSKGIEDGIYRTTLNINDTEKVVCSLRNIEEGIEIILPVNKNKIAFSFKENIARLFLCFPLIGTEHWGFNYIIHSSKFDPTEPRDGIHLKSKNEQVQESEAANRDLIQKASAMVFEFVNSFSNNVYLPLNLATINFNVSSDKPLLNEYFQGLKTEWINQFQHFPLVETEGGNIKPSEVCFLHQDLLQDDESFDAVFKIANQFWKNIPKKDLIKKWTKIIDEWSIESIKYITIEDVVGKIQEAANLSAFEEQEHLKKFYSYLITIGQVDVFNTHKLLPNIKGEFRKLVELNNSLNLPQVLIGIADIILPDIPKRHVHPDFKFNLEFAPYTRKNYTTEINDHIAKILAPIATSNLILDPNILPKLLEYCKIFSSSDSSSVPSKMIKLICKYYNHSDLLIGIPEIKEDILDVRSPQKRVLKLFLNDISKKDSEWVTENLTFLEEVISTGANYNDYMDLFQTLAVFPNQLNELRIQTKLDVDDNIPEEIKNLYDEVTVPDFPIRADLVHDKFTE